MDFPYLCRRKKLGFVLFPTGHEPVRSPPGVLKRCQRNLTTQTQTTKSGTSVHPRIASSRRAARPTRAGDQNSHPEYRDILLRILNEKLSGVENGKRRLMTRFELGLTNLANKVAKGDRLAWRDLLMTMDRFGIKLS